MYQLPRYTPGRIVSYNGDTRRARVEIAGVTDGCEVYPEAQFVLPIGSNTDNSEILVQAGDRVWLDFINGDPRFPVIIGYRTRDTGNATDWLRILFRNIEVKADTDMLLTATAGSTVMQAGQNILIKAGTKVTLEAPEFQFNGPATFSNTLTVNGLFTFNAGSEGFGEAHINNYKIDERHTHLGVRFGSDISSGIQPGR